MDAVVVIDSTPLFVLKVHIWHNVFRIYIYFVWFFIKPDHFFVHKGLLCTSYICINLKIHFWTVGIRWFKQSCPIGVDLLHMSWLPVSSWILLKWSVNLAVSISRWLVSLWHRDLRRSEDFSMFQVILHYVAILEHYCFKPTNRESYRPCGVYFLFK